jgi:hypothetical protein
MGPFIFQYGDTKNSFAADLLNEMGALVTPTKGQNPEHKKG